MFIYTVQQRLIKINQAILYRIIIDYYSSIHKIKKKFTLNTDSVHKNISSSNITNNILTRPHDTCISRKTAPPRTEDKWRKLMSKKICSPHRQMCLPIHTRCGRLAGIKSKEKVIKANCPTKTVIQIRVPKWLWMVLPTSEPGPGKSIPTQHERNCIP